MVVICGVESWTGMALTPASSITAPLGKLCGCSEPQIPLCKMGLLLPEQCGFENQTQCLKDSTNSPFLNRSARRSKGGGRKCFRRYHASLRTLPSFPRSDPPNNMFLAQHTHLFTDTQRSVITGVWDSPP